jgi:glycosyltransferase involved in cell wall biosynthesis
METAETNKEPAEIRTIKILQLMKWLSPAEDTGGKIRSFRIGKALSSFALVDAAGFVLPGEEPDGKEDHLSHYHRLYTLPLSRGARSVLPTLTSFAEGLSLRTARFSPGAFGPFVERILRETPYDAVHVEELPLMASLRSVSFDIPVIFSSHNVESELSLRLFSRRNPLLKLLAEIEYGRTVREERNAVGSARACIAVSEKDRDSLLRLSHENMTPVHVLPNCAHDRFRPSSLETPGKEILTVGAFGWYPNRDGLLWFTEKILPLVRKQIPSVMVRVAGSGINLPLRRKLEQRGIDVHADVPDILPFLQEARLLFVPLRIGGGTRIKIVEAWAAGLPVVSTALGAEGLPYRSGVDMLVADDAAGFAAQIGRLLEDDDLYGKLRSEGLKKSQNLRWSGMNSLLAKIYGNVFKNGKVVYP